MNTTKLLGNTWRDQASRRCIVAMQGRQVKHFFLPTTAKAEEAASMLSGGGWDVYFSPALFDGAKVDALKAQVNPATGNHFSGRAQTAVSEVASFWLDIDCGPGTPYADWTHGVLALLQWCAATQFYRPSAIVRSGSGLHVYWFLDAGYPQEVWKPVAQHFKQALAVGGVHTDPVRTADSASLLRVPGTFNHKDRDNPLAVEELFNDGRRLSLSSFQSALPKVGPIAPVRLPTDDEWNTTATFPEGDAEQIAQRCGQMAHMRDARGALSEPLWRAGLSVLARCANAEHYIHEWSKGDARYNPQDTARKAAGTAGPATCTHFASLDPAPCSGCPHRGKVTSPISLAVAAASPPGGDAAPADQSAPIRPGHSEDGWRATEVGKFKITDAGVYYESVAPEGGEVELVRVTEVPLWVLEVRERARDSLEADLSSLVLEWRGVDGKVKRGLVRQSVLHDKRLLTEWLADHNLISAVHEVKRLMAYISQYTLQMLKARGAKEYHDRLGWHGDGFVVGDRIVTQEGAALALTQSTSPISRLKAVGTLAGWVEAARHVGRPGMEQYGFALLCGFASPLLALADVQSAVVSLAGVSGAGKTLAARSALSIFGPSTHMTQGATATSNAIEQQLSMQKHVPYLLDEVTHMRTNRLTDFVYLAANGEGKPSLTRNRDMREPGTWQLVPFVTSNHPMLGFDQRDVQEAHRRRILEIYFADAMEREVGAFLHSGFEGNAGTAAEPYMQAVCKVKAQVADMVDKAQQVLIDHTDLPSANRFVLWTMATALVGGMIARQAGLIDWDPLPVVLHVAQTAVDSARETASDVVRGENAIREWVAAESKHVCHWPKGESSAVALGELTDGAIARVLNDTRVQLHQRAFNDVLREERISLNSMKRWLTQHEARYTVSRLAPGAPAVRVIEINATALGMSDHEEADENEQSS